MAARLLAETGHSAVLHARSAARADEARRKLPQAEAVLVGDLSSLTETRGIAEQANKLGRFDAVIHNAGVGLRERLARTAEGLPQVFAINVLAPYVLTALVERPSRLVYLSSGMHRGADASLDDVEWRKRRWDGAAAYSESKLYDVLLAFGVARRWPSVLSNAVDPGWVATKMVEGRVRKFYGEIVLTEQPFVKEPDQTISKLLEAAAAKLGGPVSVTGFLRFKLGEAPAA